MRKQYHRRTTLRPENPEECKKGTLSDQPRLSRVTYTALLCHWGWHSLKDMMSFGTDFETPAIWQGYAEDPAVKDFVVRKARAITLSKVQGTWQSTLFTSLEISWGFCHRPSGPKPGIQHDRRGRGMPTLTWEEVTIREGKRRCCNCTKKEIIRLRNDSKLALNQQVKKGVYCAEILHNPICYAQNTEVAHLTSWERSHILYKS